jgi:nucleotide-binding universal stress UspA family protein
MKTTREEKSSTSKVEARAQQVNKTTASFPLRKLKKILVPVDFSESSLKALRYAVPFAEQFGATISLAHIQEPIGYAVDLAGVSADPRFELKPQEVREKLYDVAQKEIEELVPINVHVRAGKAADEIVHLAKALETDLIIIATHGYTGFMHFVMGSTAEKVVRNAPCPVLVVREKEHEFV